ncbi:MAG: hypothetical protein V3T58_04485 [Candidatus Hydrothermarchaeales archaeon]
MKKVLDEREKRFLRTCIECEQPEMEILDGEMVTLRCATKEFEGCWNKGKP